MHILRVFFLSFHHFFFGPTEGNRHAAPTAVIIPVHR
jgi:hypothetical protein